MFADLKLQQRLISGVEPESALLERWPEANPQIQHAGVEGDALVDDLSSGSQRIVVETGNNHNRWAPLPKFS